MNRSIQKEFTELIEPHKSALFNTAYRLTRNQIYAEDLLQDAYYKAFRALNQYQKNTNFRAWIFRILVNTYITGYRKAMKQPKKVYYHVHEDSFLDVLLKDTSDFKAQAKTKNIEDLFEDDIIDALQKLPYHFRLVILLCDIEGFSYNEIANIINSPMGTVMSRLFRGRKLLQRYLKNYAKSRGYITEEPVQNNYDCNDIMTLNKHYIDDKLDPEKNKLFEEHLTECRNCNTCKVFRKAG